MFSHWSSASEEKVKLWTGICKSMSRDIKFIWFLLLFWFFFGKAHKQIANNELKQKKNFIIVIVAMQMLLNMEHAS